MLVCLKPKEPALGSHLAPNGLFFILYFPSSSLLYHRDPKSHQSPIGQQSFRAKI